MTIKDLIKYKNVWLGISIICVVFAHTNFQIKNIAIFYRLNYYGNCVSAFMLASGIGCYYSYLRDRSPLDFFRRRIIRLAPTYLPVIIIWIIISLKNGTIGITQAIGNLFAIQEFTAMGNTFNWFIGFIALCYLLTPYFASFVERNSLERNIIFILFVTVCTTVFINNYNLIIVTTRVPVFLMGMLVAKYEDTAIDSKKTIIMLFFYIIGAVILFYSFRHFTFDEMWNLGLFFYPSLIMTTFVCYIISLIASLFEKNRVLSYLNKIVSYLGKISFEVYMTHILIFDIVKANMDKITPYISNANIVQLISIIVSLIASVLLKILSDSIRNKYLKCKGYS